MPTGLTRYQHEGDDHFITFSCYRREPYLDTSHAKETFLHSLESMRQRYAFEVLGYVIMPEHVHLLVSEPPDRDKSLGAALQALKISVSRRLIERPFWHRRYYDFNVFGHNKRVEKLRYIHRNPVQRGLAGKPEDWSWSSYRFYLYRESGPVHVTRI